MASNNNNPATTAPIPPKPFRDEKAVVYAGNDSSTTFIRQSTPPQNPLVDPPHPIPNPYGWMRDETRKDSKVLEHLQEECTYTEQMTKHLEEVREELYLDMKGRMQETDYSIPVPRGDHTDGTEFLYYTRTLEGKSYRIHCRAPAPPTTSASSTTSQALFQQLQSWDKSIDQPILPNEQIYLDTNELAKDKSYCSTGNVRISPSHTKVAYTLDTVGGETYHLFIKDIETGTILYENEKEEIDSTIVWGGNDETLFFLKMDDAHRPYQVYQKSLDWKTEKSGSSISSTDKLLWEEPDELFWVHISKSQDGQFFFISSDSKETSEVHYLSLASGDENQELKVVAPRRSKVLYEVEHYQNQFYIVSNVGGTPNMRLLTSPVQPQAQDLWQDIVLQEDNQKLFDGGYDRSLDAITPFQNYLVAEGREGGLPRIWILSLPSSEEMEESKDTIIATTSSFDTLRFPEEAHTAQLGSNFCFKADYMLVSYDSLVTPPQTIKIPLSSPNDLDQRLVLKQTQVTGYNPEDYACERTTVLSRDGTTRIPVSIVYRKDVASSSSPIHTHLYGYGSYGSCVEADFRMTRLSLLDRGMVYVLAHIRGGGEMGRQWYEEPNGAKYLCKRNTFLDFVDVATWLIEGSEEKKDEPGSDGLLGKGGFTVPEKLSCEGRSAGGLLIGASINMAPEKFKVAILGVPFVDVACTMLDSTVPLTVVEWEEWGNPNETKFLDYMLSYSPMENVKKGAVYPSCLLTGGLHDPRVQYWEPSKFAAELRHQQSPESGPVCVKMDMTAGHFSASDRYKYLKELSFDYAFLLDQLGLAKTSETSGVPETD